MDSGLTILGSCGFIGLLYVGWFGCSCVYFLCTCKLALPDGWKIVLIKFKDKANLGLNRRVTQVPTSLSCVSGQIEYPEIRLHFKKTKFKCNL